MEEKGGEGWHIYASLASRRAVVLLTLAATVFFLMVLNIATGALGYSFGNVLRTIFFPDSVGSLIRATVWELRMPQALMGLAVGMALGIAGAEMQTILDNPLADPYTLGVSSAAAFGASLVLAFGFLSFLGSAALPVSAFAVSLLATFAIYAVARGRRSDKNTIVLTGVAMLFLFQALVSLVQVKSTKEGAMAIMFWMFGSLGRANWENLGIVFAVFAAVFVLFAMNSWKLTAMRLGDAKASSLGVDVPKVRRNVLIGVSIVTSVAVCFTGTIGFIGLVGPHIARMLVGEDQRYFLPTSALCGALLLLAAAYVTKAVHFATSLPIGIVTAFIGVPFFLYLVLRSRGVSG